MVTITVAPSLTTIIDQKVDITVSNLTSQQEITLRARTIDDSKVVFESVASYKADENGEVSLLSQPSLGGSYTGIEPMGLFWSMEPVGRADRDDMLRKRDVTTPLKVTVDVYINSDNAIGTFEEGDKLASVTLIRSYMRAGVSRHVVEGHGFYGTLFLPPGDGPFPGVVDMWGRTGGIREDRAALLAANGLAALAIAYSGFKDLPGSSYCVLEVSYFETAIDWLTAHPKVKPDGVGLVGLSLGGVLALGIASQLHNKIKAVVSISGPGVLLGCSLKSETTTIPGYPIDLTSGDYASYLQVVSIFKSKEACKPGSPWMVPVEHITCPVLLVYGLVDKLNPTIELMCEELFRRMEQHGKGSLCRRLGLPGAGHILIPCYIPPYSKQYAKAFNETWFLGGEDKALSAKASEKYWNESLEFLLKYI